MSNLIKYPFVNMTGKEAVVINNNKDDEKFVPLPEKTIKIKTVSEIEAEKALLRAQDEEFKEGLNVTNFDEVFEEKQKEAENKASAVLEKAREEAEQIRKEAESAVETARARGYEEGKEQGYREGMETAEQEIHQREEELAEHERQQRKEWDDCIASVEEKYVEVVISLVRKLTGVVIDGKDDLILYLIRTAANDMDPSKHYRIRVSNEDVYLLESNRKELLDSLGEEVDVEFVGEKGLEKGQCIIETDSQMVDCGFQTQLEHLVQDLRMLVH